MVASKAERGLKCLLSLAAVAPILLATHHQSNSNGFDTSGSQTMMAQVYTRLGQVLSKVWDRHHLHQPACFQIQLCTRNTCKGFPRIYREKIYIDEWRIQCLPFIFWACFSQALDSLWVQRVPCTRNSWQVWGNNSPKQSLSHRFLGISVLSIGLAPISVTLPDAGKLRWGAEVFLPQHPRQHGRWG